MDSRRIPGREVRVVTILALAAADDGHGWGSPFSTILTMQLLFGALIHTTDVILVLCQQSMDMPYRGIAIGGMPFSIHG